MPAYHSTKLFLEVFGIRRNLQRIRVVAPNVTHPGVLRARC